MKYCYLDTPMASIGSLLLAGDDEGLHYIGFSKGKGRVTPEPGWQRDDRAMPEARSQLGEYLAGRRRTFDLPLCIAGTSFQRQVLTGLEQIPYGQVLSYGELAGRLGRPGAARAVGAALARNPLPLVIPCHRVVGGNGSLTGFGGGLGAKKALLALERG